MKPAFLYYFLFFSIAIISCNGNGSKFDATGVFESEEIIVSAEATGKIIRLNVEEGMELQKDSVVGNIDPIQYELQAEQLEASIEAVQSKTVSSSPQIKILESQEQLQQEQRKGIQIQLNTTITERNRVEKLVKADAASGKQLDDLNAQVDMLKQQLKSAESQIQVTKQQIASQRELTSIQNRGITSEKAPLEKRKAMAVDFLNKSKIINPVSGTVLTTYMHEGEVVTPGKALYKIADLKEMTLRAYISGSQLSKIKLNQDVKVFVDHGESDFKEYQGTVFYISDKAEFTPKTIQTKDERNNLVYAVKIKVVNDGYLKLGMYGEIKF
jgi:HlyD family secretion protein